ncbi:hypothetical protein R0J90_12910 [Micrococcus sp. SIMBA_144]
MNKATIITQKLYLCDLKSRILNITLSLEDDENYTKENAVDDLFKAVKDIEVIEEVI